jgi:hypothetical protein
VRGSRDEVWRGDPGTLILERTRPSNAKYLFGNRRVSGTIHARPASGSAAPPSLDDGAVLQRKALTWAVLGPFPSRGRSWRTTQ